MCVASVTSERASLEVPGIGAPALPSPLGLEALPPAWRSPSSASLQPPAGGGDAASAAAAVGQASQLRDTAISIHTKTAKDRNLVGEEGGFFGDSAKMQVKGLRGLGVGCLFGEASTGPRLQHCLGGEEIDPRRHRDGQLWGEQPSISGRPWPGFLGLCGTAASVDLDPDRTPESCFLHDPSPESPRLTRLTRLRVWIGTTRMSSLWSRGRDHVFGSAEEGSPVDLCRRRPPKFR